RLALMATCMLGAVTSASVSAETLPKLSVETGGTGKYGKSKLNLAGANLMSTSGEISFTTTPGTEGRLGTYSDTSKEVTLIGEPCLSLGDALGTVLETGTWHLVHLPKNPKHISKLMLVNESHVECPAFGLLLLKLAGSTLLLLITPVEVKTKAFKLLANVKEGKQETNEWVDDAGTTHTTELLIGLNSGKDKKATEEIEGIELTSEKETVVQEK